MTTKQIALQYLGKGLSIIPLKSPSMLSRNLTTKEFIRQCKVPLVGWKEFQNRTWFNKWPDANIGIITGKISGLVVFDLDSEHAVQYAEDEGGFPDNPKVKNGKGYHHYLRYPGFEVRNDVKKELDIDIRADGGYVVAPPSWMIDYLEDVANSPSKPAKEKPPKTSESPDTESKPAAVDAYADILKNGAQEGQRNHTTTKLIGHLFGKGNDETVVWELVKQWNVSKNSPPLDDTELRKCFESIKRLDGKNEKKKKEKKDIDVVQFLDTEKRVTAEYDEQYFRVPFAGSLLSIMESKMNGGLIGGRTYVLGGIPSSCKTALANNLTDNICLNGHPVLFFSYDDGRIELRYRTYSRFSGFDIEEFNNRRLSKSDVEAIYRNDSISSISKLKYTVQEILKIEDTRFRKY